MTKLLIIDSAFLNNQSPFRYIEHKLLLKKYPESVGWNPALFPNQRPTEQFDFGYTVGLQQAYEYLTHFEQLNLKFCFTLYPGFTFFLNDPHTDRLLKTVINHPLFHKVFTTTKTARDYIPIDSIYHCGGFVTHKQNITPKRNKPKIWFCAWGRYQNEGTIKGFDLFYKTAQMMPDYEFGAYSDWVWKELPNLKLYPFSDVNTILEQYAFGDIFLATGRSIDGKFDGFPTGGAVEAGLAGCALVVTDPLNNNEHLIHNRHAMIVQPNEVTQAVQELCSNESKRLQIAQEGFNLLKDIYDHESQIKPRYALFDN